MGPCKAAEARFVHGIGDEEMPCAGNDNGAGEEARLLKRIEEGHRLRRRIDNVVIGAVQQQEGCGIFVYGRVADR